MNAKYGKSGLPVGDAVAELAEGGLDGVARPASPGGAVSMSHLTSLSVNIPGMDAPLSLNKLLALTRDWDKTNARRLALIGKKFPKVISAQEQDELESLQDLVDVKRLLVMSLPIAELSEIEAALRAANQWQCVQ